MKKSLSTTQIGSLAENLIANELMIESDGRLSPFQPIADDDGVDLLIYDKVTGKSLPIQVKSRTSTIAKPRKTERGNTVHFEVRKTALKKDKYALILCILLDSKLRSTERAWLFSMKQIPKLASSRDNKYVIRANKQTNTKDKYKEYQCESVKDLSNRIIDIFEEST